MTVDHSRKTAFDVVLRRPVAILMVTIATVVFGVFSYRLLPVELMPDVSYPSLTVRTEYSGAAPQEVEENVTRPVEEALGVVGGLVRMSSASRAGLSDVTLEFTWDTSMSEAWQEVTEQLDTILLPEDAGKPLILRYDPALDPVVRLALASGREQDSGPGGLKRLRTWAEEDLKRRLERVEGVAAVRVLGGLEEQVAVDLDEEALRRTGLSIQEVVRRIGAENVNLAGGDLKEGDTQYLVRTLNEFSALDEIADLVVARIDGREMRVRDLGTVRSGWADREVITRVAQREAVEIEVQKEADANLVSMAEAVRLAIDGKPGDDGQPAEPGLRGDLPVGWTLDVVSDRSTFVRASVDEVRSTAVLGGLLAILVLYLFLREFRMTAIVALAIPISVAATFAPMNLAGLSLNIMSLGGLALGVGMLVDSGIVVVESIARCREEGDSPADAVVRGTSEVGMAVMASTLTTVAVFFPMVFVEGVAGQVFGDLALAVVFSLLASVLVALYLVPALAARILEGDPRHEGALWNAWKERLRRTLRFRTLNPLTRDDAPGWARVMRLILVPLPLLAPVAVPVLVRWFGDLFAGFAAPAARGGAPRGGPPAAEAAEAVAAGPLDAFATPSAVAVLTILGIAVVANLILRARERGSIGGALWAVAQAPFDAVAALVESLWLLLLVAIGSAVAVLAVAWRIAGWILRWPVRPVLNGFEAAFGWIQRSYPRLLRAALRGRAQVLGLAAMLFAVALAMFLRLDATLIPEVHQGEFDLEVTMPVGTPLEQTLAAIAPLERWAVEDPRIERVVMQVGADPEADSGPEEGEHTARLSMRLAPEPPPSGIGGRVAATFRRIVEGLRHADVGGAVALREEAVIRDLRERFGGIADLQARVTRPVLFSFRSPIEVEVESYDLGDLRRRGEAVRAALDTIPFLSDVKTTARPGSPEVQIVYDRTELIRRGLDVRNVAELVRTKVRGSSATEYRKRERRIDVVVRLREGDRASVRQIENLIVNPGATIAVPLTAVARVEIAAGPADIRRVSQRRVALVQANLSGGGLGEAREAIEDRLGALDWPQGTSWRLSGQVQEMEGSLTSLWIALALASFLVYVVMASQFESLLHPLVIMLTVPLALVGVAAVLWLLGIPLSVVVFLGMIMLAGIVVNNAIVLVDYVNTLRGRGVALEDALVEAGVVRLRPIFMTTATTVLGLVPMALGLGDGAEIRTPMAITVIAGLTVSTLLTLIVVPVAYAALESTLGRVRGRDAAPAAVAPADAGGA